MASTSPIKKHVITCLRVYQCVEGLTVSQQPGESLNITSSCDIVVHCDAKRNSLDIYGLGAAKTVRHAGQTFIEYIDKSSKTFSSATKQIHENCIPRSQFVGPSTQLCIANVQLSLTSLQLSGVISLNAISANCIDSRCNSSQLFTLSLHKTAILRCPLAAVVVLANLHDESTISSYQMIDDQRCLWSVHNLILEVDQCKRIEGVSVANCLTINSPKQRVISASIGKSDSCIEKYRPTSLIVTPDTAPSFLVYTGDRHHRHQHVESLEERHARYTSNLRNGLNIEEFLASALVEDDFSLENIQSVLDESREEYEADSTPPSIIPQSKHVAIDGRVTDDATEAPMAQPKGRCCTVCQEKYPSVALSCGHRPLCTDCVKDYQKYSKRCPVCREKIKHITVLY